MLELRGVHVASTTILDESPVSRLTRAVEVIIRQRDALHEQTSEPIERGSAVHALCSTTLGEAFSWGRASWQDTATHLQQGLEVEVVFMDAYECASWGFALRFLATFTQAPRIFISIVDVNVLGLTRWDHNDSWGRSGFTVTTVVFDRCGEDNLGLWLGSTGAGLSEFGMIIRRKVKEIGSLSIALPYGPDRAWRVLTSGLQNYSLLKNGYDKWGHCFGGDPWIAIAEDLSALHNPGEQRYLSCSLALRGYYSLLEVKTSKGIAVIFQSY